jgi:ParB family transcriptional regulator, chromosome partitioning protein
VRPLSANKLTSSSLTSKNAEGQLQEFLHGTNGREQKMDWLPPYFQFPPKAYIERGGVGVVNSWNMAAALFTS